MISNGFNWYKFLFILNVGAFMHNMGSKYGVMLQLTLVPLVLNLSNHVI